MLNYFYKNVNPKGKETADCVTRALTLATELPYEDIVKLQMQYSLETGESFANKVVYEKILSEYGYVKQKQPKHRDGTMYCIEHMDELLTDDQLSGGVFVSVNGHVSFIKGKYYYDIWDCGDCCVRSYYLKKEFESLIVKKELQKAVPHNKEKLNSNKKPLTISKTIEQKKDSNITQENQQKTEELYTEIKKTDTTPKIEVKIDEKIIYPLKKQRNTKIYNINFTRMITIYCLFLFVCIGVYFMHKYEVATAFEEWFGSKLTYKPHDWAHWGFLGKTSFNELINSPGAEMIFFAWPICVIGLLAEIVVWLLSYMIYGFLWGVFGISFGLVWAIQHFLFITDCVIINLIYFIKTEKAENSKCARNFYYPLLVISSATTILISVNVFFT